MSTEPTFTAFLDAKRVSEGSLVETLTAVKRHLGSDVTPPVLVFRDATGEQLDFDWRGSLDEVLERLQTEPDRKPGRPKLGVLAREVTLLGRHWEWLEKQPGGASANLRRLVETATTDPVGVARSAREAVSKVMTALAGDAPGYEAASRALFGGDADGFWAAMDAWPEDVRGYVARLAGPCFEGAQGGRLSTQRRKALLAEFIERVWNQGDAEASDGYLADTYTIHSDPGDPWEGQTLNRAQFRERVRLSRAAAPDQKFVIQGWFEGEEALTIIWTWQGTHLGDMPGFPASGATLSMSGATVYSFDGQDRLTGHWQIADRLGVYRQLQTALQGSKPAS